MTWLGKPKSDNGNNNNDNSKDVDDNRDKTPLAEGAGIVKAVARSLGERELAEARQEAGPSSSRWAFKSVLTIAH